MSLIEKRKHKVLEKLTLNICLSDKGLIVSSYVENSIIIRARYK